MEITRKTIRKSFCISVDDIDKIKHEIYAFTNNNSENIYFLIGEPMNAEIYFNLMQFDNEERRFTILYYFKRCYGIF